MKEYNSATVLYFKAVFGLLDYRILCSEREMPKDHAERFRILEKKFPHDYAFLDRVFVEYQRSYSMSVGKRVCDEVKNYAHKLSKKLKLL